MRLHVEWPNKKKNFLKTAGTQFFQSSKQKRIEKYAAKWKFMQEKLKGDISLSYVHTKSRIGMHFLTLIVYDIPFEEFYNLFKIKIARFQQWL